MARDKYIIAIDGPAGAGKSTVSKAVAKKLSYLYIDTGAMYRAVAWKALKNSIGFSEENKVVDMTENTKLELKPSSRPGSLLDIFVDSEDVTDKIRTNEISQGASRVSAIEGVRRVLQQKQRQIGKNGGIVMEGRDIGTAVFPDAEYKFYMDASVEERARRRYKELAEKGGKVTLEHIKEEIRERDERDKKRKTDPLTQAEDAVIIDSTGLTIEGTADLIVGYIEKKTKIYDTKWLFYLGRFLFRLFFYAVWRLKVRGHENIPEKGGVIISPNHVSYADPPLTGSAMKRPLYFMAKKELFDMPVLGFLIKRTNAFPVQRGRQDVGAFKKAVNLLKAGKPVLVFPEGTRSRDGNFGKARPGAGMLSCISNAPVVPVRLRNSGRLSKLMPLEVTFGRPVYPPEKFTKDTYQEISEKVLEEIKKL
jgi:cytidylate kinase